MPKQRHPKRLIPPSRKYPKWMEKSGDDLIYLAWGERRFELEPVPTHRNGGWVYWLVTEGRILIQFENEIKSFGPSTGIVAGPESAFGFPSKDQQPSRILAWIWRKPSPIFSSIAADSYQELKFSDTDVELLQVLHRQSRNECLNSDSLSPVIGENIKSMVSSTFTRAINRNELLHKDEAQLRTARQWMLEHLDASRPVEDLARYLNVSSVTLHRLFKEQLNEPPGIHFRRLKMERARELLQRKQFSVKHIAYELGYQYPNDFSRAYREFWGNPPSDKTIG